MSKIDYDLKSEVLSQHQNVLQLQRTFSRLNYLQQYTDVDIDPSYIETVSEAVSVFFESSEQLAIWREAERINLAYYARVKRLKDRIACMLSEGMCYFLTLTFSDVTLNKTSQQTRRKYVTRFLRSQSDTYVANIDYGAQNGREHYHAVIQSDSVNMSLWDCYGFSNAKIIGSEDDYTPVAKYISKLTNHAIKATTQGCRAIYSN